MSDAENVNWIQIEALSAPSTTSSLIGASPAMAKVNDAIHRFAPYPGCVLITGESGSGKEVVARQIHQMSRCANGPLVSFNCSNLVEGLAESQLFGHVKGAFTDARDKHPGCFRQADGGTLMLDEIGDLPVGIQAKLLRVTESGEIQALGSTESVKLSVRLLAATNRDLPAMVKAGEFRADLFYRLNVASLRVPGLRDRPEDLGPLIAHFTQLHNRAFGKQVRLISPRAFAALRAHQWPGNVRELSHAMERAILLGDDDRIDLDHFPEYLVESARNQPPPPSGSAEAYSIVAPLDKIVKRAILRSLQAARGDCAAAARLLGISRPAIYRKMVHFGISNGSIRAIRRAANHQSGNYSSAFEISLGNDQSTAG
jgi:DNA-binding NtrC family response regulator